MPCNVSESHDRNNDTTYFGDPLNASENDQNGQYGQYPANNPVIESECPFPRSTNRITLYGIESKTEGDRDQYGKKYSHPP